MARNPFLEAARQVPVPARAWRDGPRTLRAASWGGSHGPNAKMRHAQDLYGFNVSADYDLRAWLAPMRGVTRRLCSENPYAVGFLRELANHIVGPKGILLQAKIKNGRGELARSTNAEIERGWKEWGYKENASADGRLNWVSIQRLIIQSIAMDGEVFLRRLRGFDNPFGYALQFLDPDLVDEQYNVPADRSETGNAIRMGVEIDHWNRPVAYHVWNCYAFEANGASRKRERIPASEILHLFVPQRPNQTRGMTWFACVVSNLHHIDGFEDAELRAARLAAEKMGFIRNVHPDAVAAYKPPEAGKQRTFEVDGGAIPELLPGQDFVAFDPNHPNANLDQFTGAVLRSVSRGLPVSYLTLTGDTRNANYSSQRAATTPERDGFRCIQLWLAEDGCRVIYRDWIDLASLNPAVLKVDSRLGSDFYDVQWRPRGWKHIDPLNDAQAYQILRTEGLVSRQTAAAELSQEDFEDVIDELAYEAEYAEEAGVDVSGAKPGSASVATAKRGDDGEPLPDAPDPTETTTTDRPMPGPGAEARRLRLVAAGSNAALGGR